MFLLSGCFVTNVSPDPSFLIGEWSWVESVGGGWAGPNLNPDSDGYGKRALRYTADYTFSLYQNDALISSGSYFLEETESGILVSYSDVKGAPHPDELIWSPDDGVLELRPLCEDCHYHIYQRIP